MNDFGLGLLVGIIIGVFAVLSLATLAARGEKTAKENDPADWWKRGEEPPR